MHGVYQGFAGLVFLVKMIQAFAGEHEGCYLAIIEADAGQVSAVGKQVCS